MFLRQYILVIAWMVIDIYKSNIIAGEDNISQTIYTGYCLDGNRYIRVKYYNCGDNVFQTIYTYTLAIAWTVIYIYMYITDLVCYTYFHWFFNPECQHIFGKQTGYIFQSPKTIKTWTTKHYASLNQWYITE